MMPTWYVRIAGGPVLLFCGDRDAIVDAFYEAGALGVSILPTGD